MTSKKGVKIIITFSISKILKKLGLSDDDLCDFILKYWNIDIFVESNKLVKLYSPSKDTIAYKGYFTNLDRTIIFHYSKNHKGVVYPIFFGNKRSNLGKNITKILVEKDIDNYNNIFLSELKEKNYKIYHK